MAAKLSECINKHVRLEIRLMLAEAWRDLLEETDTSELVFVTDVIDEDADGKLE
jgi:hypothetical protein